MKTKYYIVVMENCSISQNGPFGSEEERDREAREIWKTMKPERGDNLHKAEIDSFGELQMSDYLQGELDE
jgi:hypothetical protein